MTGRWQFGIAPVSKLVVLGEGSSNGVNPRDFHREPRAFANNSGSHSMRLVLGFCGRLTGDKGLPELLEAFAAILRYEPKAYLLFVGWFDASEDALELRSESSESKDIRGLSAPALWKTRRLTTVRWI